MNIKTISPDQIVYLELWGQPLNATIVYTWGVMLLIVFGGWLVTRNLSSDEQPSGWQNFLEAVVSYIEKEIRDITGENEVEAYLSFVGTLFLFIAVSNLLSVVPGFVPPTASLSTTSGLALCVFVAVFGFGIASRGVLGYFAQYTKPTPMMIPFNIMGELSRTLALAVRLFGNMMSGSKIAAILLAIAPLVFPVIMNLLGIVTGFIQAYIFAVLAMVYIASAVRARREREQQNGTDQ